MYTEEPEYNHELDISEEVLNLSTNRWIKKDGKLYKRLLREGYKYAKDLSHYLEDVPPIDIGDYGTIYLLDDFFHPALIPPLSILARRRDICRRCPINMRSAIEGGMSLFTTERNGQTSFQNLIHLNYSSLSTLIEICWDDNKTREWRDDILMKFLHHPHSISSKNRPNALYDAFSKADVLGPEHMLAIARTLQ